MAGGSTRAIIAAFFANLGIAIAKLVGFFITRSSSMLAESIHSFADTSNQALLLYGGRASVRTAETNQGNLVADALLWQARRLAARFGVGLNEFSRWFV